MALSTMASMRDLARVLRLEPAASFRPSARVSSVWSSEPQFTPMRTGRSYSMAASIMVRKLSSCFLPMFTLPGLMRYFGQSAGAVRIFLEQQMAVVVKVADDGHAHAELFERGGNLRHRAQRPPRC